jgi:hypothetical protein
MNISRLFLLCSASIVLTLASGCAGASNASSEDSASEDSDLRGQRHFSCTAQTADNGVADSLTLRVSTLTATVTIPGATGQRGDLDPSFEPRTNTAYYRYLVNTSDADAGYLLVQKALLSGHPGTLKVRMDTPESGGTVAFDCTP